MIDILTCHTYDYSPFGRVGCALSLKFGLCNLIIHIPYFVFEFMSIVLAN